MIRHTAQILLSALFIALTSALIITFIASYFYWQQLIPWAAERWLQEHNWQVIEIQGAAPGIKGWQIDSLSLQQTSSPNANTQIQLHQLNIDWDLPRLFAKGKLEQIKLQSADIQLAPSTSEAVSPVDLTPWLSPAVISRIPADNIQLKNVSIQRNQPQVVSRILNNVNLTNGRLNWHSRIVSFPSNSGLEGLTAEVNTQLTRQTDSPTASLLLKPFDLKVNYQNRPLVSSKGDLLLGETIQLSAEHKLTLKNIAALFTTILPQSSASPLITQKILPLLNGTLTIKGKIRIQPQYNPSSPLQSLLPESEQQISLNLLPVSLSTLNLADISGTAALRLNSTVSLTPETLRFTVTDNSQISINDLQSASLHSKNLLMSLLNSIDIEVPLADLNAPDLHLNIPKTAFILRSQDSIITSSSTPLALSHQPIHLTTNQLSLCIAAGCSLKPLNISGALSSKDISITHPRFNLPTADLSTHWKLQQKVENTDLKQQFNLTLFDTLLPKGQLQIRGNSRTRITPDKQPLTTANWQTKLAPLTGIEALIKRYYPDIPDELTLSEGRLSHQGALHLEDNRLALRLRQRIEGLNGQYQQNTWVGLNWHSDFRRSLRGKLRDDGNLSINFIAAGIPIEQFSSDYQLQPVNGKPKALQLRLTKPHAQLLGGEVIADDFTISESFELKTLLTLNKIQLTDVLALEQQEGLNGEGTLQGSFPLEKNAAGFQVNNGQIKNIGVGWIRYQPTPELESLANTTPGLGTAFKALENLRYSQLSIGLNYQPDGSTHLNTRLQGMNPDWNAGQKIDFGINIEENLLQLIKALQYTNKLTRSLEKRYR